MGNSKINYKYKDRLFCLLFGTEEYKENILSLYNALNNTNITDKDIITIYTLDDVIYIKMKNDVSVLIDNYLSLWEQQSTYCPNMPVRGLMYFGNMYEKYIDENSLNIYGKSLVKIPTPKYIIIYNGTSEAPSKEKLKLSDAFINPTDNGEFEWTATLYNVNPDKNNDLLKKCKPLNEYMELINRIRKNSEYLPIEKAIDNAVDSCINDGILVDILSKHKAEVRNVCLTEFNETVFVNGIRKESFDEGRNEGQNELVKAIKLLRAGQCDEEVLAAGISEDTLALAHTIK